MGKYWDACLLVLFAVAETADVDADVDVDVDVAFAVAPVFAFAVVLAEALTVALLSSSTRSLCASLPWVAG